MVVARPDLVVLLGVMPDSTNVEDGWIEPGERIAGPRPELHRARHFWDKPSPEWSDLGASGRVISTLARSGARPAWVADPPSGALRGASTQL